MRDGQAHHPAAVLARGRCECRPRLPRPKLQVYFLPNYRVSAAEMLMPAAQVSEQISTAGKEASGTGNMKLMMNGAVTIGTLDGANVEMFEQLGADNMFLFGLHADEAEALRAAGYDPQAYVRRSPWLGRVLERMSRGYADGESYADLVSSLLYGGDPYLLLADFDDYTPPRTSGCTPRSPTPPRARVCRSSTLPAAAFSPPTALCANTPSASGRCTHETRMSVLSAP